MFVTAEDSGVVEYDQSGDGHFDGLLVYSRLKSAAAEKGVLIWWQVGVANEHGPPAERGIPGGERDLHHQLLHPPTHLHQPAKRAGQHPL